MPVVIRKISLLFRMTIRLIVFFSRFWIFTLRMRVTPNAEKYLSSGASSCLLLIWHNRMLIAISVFSRVGKHLKLTALASASSDGAITAEVMDAFGLHVVRGSSSRRGVEATRELLAAMDGGRNIVITPDGPRGPIYVVKGGSEEIGRCHAKAIYILGFKCSRYLQLKTWDEFMIPWPFSRIDLDIEKIETDSGFTEEKLQETLNRLNGNSPAGAGGKPTDNPTVPV